MQRSSIRYLDFDLVLDRSADAYEARVLHSPMGQARHGFGPLSAVEAERIKTFRAIVSGHRVGKRRIDSPEMHAAKEVGGSLFARVFDGPVGECWRSSLDRVRREASTGLRVRLRMGSAPELAELPWEFLYDAVENQFLSLSVYTPLVRYMEIRRPVQPLSVAPPLRVLVMISNPSDIDDLDVEEEWRQLREAVGDLESRGLVTFDRLEHATLEELQRRLRRDEYHVFHYIGHAGFDDTSDDGLLVLENEKGRSQLVNAERLGNILHDEDTLRLAILNACEGARSSRKDPFSGLAQSLVQKGIPAVIAMQYEISDEAAILLSHEFYRALGEGYPADAALGEARKMISNSNALEWGTPVLFLRSPDGTLFDVGEADEASRRSGQVHGLVRDARAALAGGRWDEAAEKAEAALALESSHVEAAGIAAQARRSLEVVRLQNVASAGPARRRVLPGCTVAITMSFAALAGIIGVSQLQWSGRAGPPAVEAAAPGEAGADPEDVASPPPGTSPGIPAGPIGSGGMTAAPAGGSGAQAEVAVAAAEQRRERVRAEVREAVQRASEAEAEAFRSGDASLLYGSYAGPALDLLLENLSALAIGGMHQDASLVDREWRSIELDAEEGTAVVTMIEIWTTEYHQNGTDVCLGRFDRHPVPQRLTLSRAAGRWVVVAVESNAGTPVPTPCG